MDSTNPNLPPSDSRSSKPASSGIWSSWRARAFSIVIISQRGTRVRSLAVSRWSLRLLLCTASLFLALGSLFVGDYFWTKVRLSKENASNTRLDATVASLSSKMTDQQNALLNIRRELKSSRESLSKARGERRLEKALRDQIGDQARSLSEQVKAQQNELLDLRKRVKANRTLLVKVKGEKKKETTLRTRLSALAKALRAQVNAQRGKMLQLSKQVNSAQQLVSNWMRLRQKVLASIPKKNSSSLNGQDLVGELKTSIASLQKDLEKLITSIPSQWPIEGWISSGFGKRRSPWTGKADFHTGIDIASRKGTPIHAPGDGVVDFAGNSNGKNIVLDHGQGITTLYGHLSKILVKKGDRIRKNQLIAKVGNTEKSTNPHLHFELRVNGLPINPQKYLIKGKPHRS